MDSFALDLVPIFGIVCLFGLPVVAFIIHRVLKHQERIEMIRQGMRPDQARIDMFRNSAPPPGDAASSAGWAPPPPAGSINPGMYGYEAYVAAQNQLRKGLTTGLIGLALFIGLSFIDIGRPGPWLLGGLIPMFVGIAQVLIALMSGARFNFGPPPGPYQAPPASMSGPGPQMNQPRDVTPGSYAYRPGSTTELEPPAGPPDKRF